MIGGGIHGVAVARDATLRGLRVRLVEQGDLASGTSSRTSKLVHGGIRYLETGQFALVREALRERAILLRTAPSFVHRLPFTIPHYRHSGRSRAWVGLGVTLYSLLSGGSGGMPPPQIVPSPRRALELVPGLNPSGLMGLTLFTDAQMDDARLCVALALDAAREGLTIQTYTRVTGLSPEGEGWRASIESTLDGSGGEARARFVVNAAGAWADDVERFLRSPSLVAAPAGPPAARLERLVRRTRGTHIVTHAATPRHHALLLTARRDGRVFFVLPWGDHSLIGTTDVDDDRAPEQVLPTAEDVRYLLEEAAHALPWIARTRPLRAFAGVRSLVRTGAARPWVNAREHRVVRGRRSMTLIGGKYTTHRSLAERVVDAIVNTLGATARPCSTREREVPDDRAAIQDLRTSYPDTVEVPGEFEIGEAEVAHAVDRAFARRLDDVLLRRTRLWLDARALREGLGPVARWMAPRLGWSDARVADEMKRMTTMLDGESKAVEEAMR